MHQDLQTRERRFKDFLNCISNEILSATKIEVTEIAYSQYLFPTDQSRITKAPKKTPYIKGKSRIKCTFFLDCSYKKLNERNSSWANSTRAKIDNILARQWKLIEIENHPDKCGILISVNPHNIG